VRVLVRLRVAVGAVEVIFIYICTFMYRLYICCICAAVRMQCNGKEERVYRVYAIYVYILSSKIVAMLLNILDSFFLVQAQTEGHRVLIFSQMTRMLDILEVSQKEKKKGEESLLRFHM
jgi:SNF2 family DNA or RNA helicase